MDMTSGQRYAQVQRSTSLKVFEYDTIPRSHSSTVQTFNIATENGVLFNLKRH